MRIFSYFSMLVSDISGLKCFEGFFFFLLLNPLSLGFLDVIDKEREKE